MNKIITSLVLATMTAFSGGVYSAAEAEAHIGEHATVCGMVASTHYARRSRGKPTFLNLDAAYPNQIFTVVIFGDDRGNFGRPEATYKGRNICVKGKIKNYRGTAEMIVYAPSQIAIR